MQPHAFSLDVPSVSAAYERALRVFQRARGLGQVRAGRDDELMPASRVEGRSFGLALARGGRELGDAAPGLAFGARVGGAGFGLLGVAAATAPTLRDSVRQLRRFESLTSTLGHMDLRHDGRQVSLLWRPARADTSPDVAEAILTGWVSFGRFLLGAQAEVVEVAFSHRPTAAPRVYEDVLACPVRFDASENRVTVSAELLDARPRYAERGVHAALDAWLDRCTLGIDACDPRPASRQVAAMLAQGLPLAEADESVVARRLGMSCRSLQRRLDAEGTQFRHLLDAARAQHAVVAVLRGSTPLAQLGADIGFNEQSSLCRAFRRWTGHAPLALKGLLQGMFDELRPPAG